MGVDYMNCSICGLIFSDAGDYSYCDDCGENFCLECTEKYKIEYNDDTDKHEPCPVCTHKVVLESNLLVYALELLGKTKEELEEQYKIIEGI